MSTPEIVVCSFHTPDDYYRTHADRLRSGLDRLGIEHVVEGVEKEPGQDWADICRKKVAFLADICDSHPDRRVFWIDVDCSLLSLPDYVSRSTADLVGFQRGFGSPLRIGYGQRTRFWEPCFFGIGPTPGGRAFVRSARSLEADADLRATDDYFFEEAWRRHAGDLTFQMLPSTAVLHRIDPASPSTVQPFFAFGSSGKVAEFRDKVVQHGGVLDTRLPLSTRLRSTGLRAAKRVERALPTRVAAPLRRAADGAGLTQTLTGGDLDPGRLAAGGVVSPHRQQLITSMVVSGQRGDAAALESAYTRLTTTAPPTALDVAARGAANAFLAYAEATVPDVSPIRVAWWVRPFPGNFGDWLSPLLVRHATGAPVQYQPLTATGREPHLVAVGSVGRFIKPSSVVVGTGVSSTDVALDPRACYHSVRGPVTAEVLRASGGPTITSFGDPAVLLRRVLPVTREQTNGRLALVRHVTHSALPLALPENIDELSVLVSQPGQIRALVERLAGFDGVVTSAMHVMIACHSYGIPCGLVTFEGLESAVHGSGIKYRDYALGAEVGVHEPVALPADLRRVDLASLMHHEHTPEHVLDQVQAALAAAVTDPALGVSALTAAVSRVAPVSRPTLTLGWSTLADRAGEIRFPDLDGVSDVEVVVAVQGGGSLRLPDGARLLELPGTGVARSRNAVIAHARGRYLMFCDDDITVRLDGALAASRFLARTGHALALGAATDLDGSPRKRYPTTQHRLGLLGAGRAATYEMVIDVDAVRRAGLTFDERFGAGAQLPLGDEYVFIADLLRAGLRADAVPWVLAAHPQSSSGHRWGTDADAHHRAVVLNRVFGVWALPARAMFAVKHARRLGGAARLLRFVADGAAPACDR